MHINVTASSSPGWTCAAADFDSSSAVCISAGGDGHQPHGVVSSQQPGQLLQPAPRKQGARGGGEQRGRVIAQETCQGMKPHQCLNTYRKYCVTTLHTSML